MTRQCVSCGRNERQQGAPVWVPRNPALCGKFIVPTRNQIPGHSPRLHSQVSLDTGYCTEAAFTLYTTSLQGDVCTREPIKVGEGTRPHRRGCAQHTAGGESRKSGKPFAFAKSKASPLPIIKRSPEQKHQLNGLGSLILRNVSNNISSSSQFKAVAPS